MADRLNLSPAQAVYVAARMEKRAAQIYTDFAAASHGETKETFLLIARQERRHLERLLGQIFLLEEEMNA